MDMKKITMFALAAMMSVGSVFAQEEEKPKKKMPSSPKIFRQLKAATKEAAKYDAPIFVAVVAKGTPQEKMVKKVLSNKFFKELAQKGFFVYTMSVQLHKKEKDIDGRSPKPLYEKLTAEDQALLDVICPPDKLRKLPVFGMVTPDGKEAKIKPVDMPRVSFGASDYYGKYLQDLQSAAQAYGIDIEMSKEMRKYIENPPTEKKKGKGKKN